MYSTCNFMLGQHARNFSILSFFFFHSETMEFSKVKCIKSSLLRLLLPSFVWLTLFTTDARNRHLTADQICPSLRAYSLTRVVHHSTYKSPPEPGVCRSACGCNVGVCVYVSEHKQGCFSYDVVSCFAALNHQLLSEMLPVWNRLQWS